MAEDNALGSAPAKFRKCLRITFRVILELDAINMRHFDRVISTVVQPVVIAFS